MKPKQTVQSVEQRLAAAESRNTELELENEILRSELKGSDPSFSTSSSVLESISDGFVAVDSSFRCIWVNSGAERLLGSSREQIIGKPIWELLPGATPEMEASFRAAMTMGLAVEVESFYAPSNRWFFTKASPTPDGGLAIYWRDITESKHAEAEIKRQASVLNQVHDSIISSDLEGKIVGWNRGAEKIFGYGRAEVIGQSAAILYFEEDRPQVATKVLQPLLEQGYLETEVRNRRKCGEECFVALSLSLLRDDANQPYGMLGVATDTTLQRAAEREQRADQERLQLAIDAMHAVVYEWDLQKGEAQIKGDLKALIGFAAKNGVITHKSWTSRIHLDDVARTKDQIELALAGRERTANLSYRMRHADGRWLHIQDHALIVRDHHGAAMRVVGNVVDVSRSVHLTQELQSREQILNAVGDPVIVIDGNYCIRYFNAAVERMYGVKLAEVAGKSLQTIHEYRWLNPEDEGQAYSQLKENGVWCGETVHVLTDGREIPVWSKVTSLPAEAGGGMIAIIRDITEEKRAVVEREQRAAELERANQDLTHFAYAVAHDLKTPLRNVTISAQLLALRYEGFLDDQANTYIRYVVEGSRRLGTMLNDLMRVAEAAGRPIDLLETFSLDEAVRSAIENLHSVIEESGATIVHESLPSVSGSLGGLTQLFQNLIGNSLKYRKPDLAPEIHISVRRSEDDFVISVRDNGIGFEPAHAAKIFGVFQRLHTNEFEGTGVGLTICKQIVERAGGRIWATGIPGEGANFYFTLHAESRLGQPELASIRSVVAATAPLTYAPSDSHFDEFFNLLDLSQAMVRKLDGTIVVWTQRAEQMFGFTKSEAIGQIGQELLRTEFPEPLADIHAQLLKCGVWSGEVTRYSRDGTAFTLTTHWSLYRDGSGRPQSVIEVFTDITALKQAELELEQSSRQRDLALSAGKMGVWRWDSRTGVVEWDTTIKDILGLAPGSFERTFDAFFSRVHPSDRLEVQNRIAEALEAGTDYEIELRILHADGKYRWLHGQGEVVLKDGAAAGLLGVVWDVSTYRQNLDQIQALGEKLKLGIHVSELALAEIDYETNTNTLSAEAAHLFGLGDEAISVPREVVHKTFHPGDRDELSRRIAASLDPAGSGEFKMDYRVVWPDGQVRWVNARKQVFFTGSGEARHPLNAILAAIDITDRKQAELDSLFEVNLSAKTTLCEDRSSLLQIVVSELAAYTNTSGCTFAKIDLDRRLSETVAQSGADPSLPLGPLPLDAWGPIVGDLEANQPAVVNDVKTDPRTKNQAETYGEIQAFLTVPLQSEGRWVAAIGIFSRRPRVWTEREVEVLRSVSALAWLELDNLRLRQINKKRLAQFEETFNQAAVGIAHVGQDGRWVRVNRRLCEIVGYSPQELMASDFQQITHADDLQLDLDHFAALHRGETASYSMEKRYIHKNGSTVWIHLTVSMSQGDATSRYAISVVEDISARKEEEAKLNQAEQRFRTAVSAVSDIVWTNNEKGEMEGEQPAWGRFTGQSLQEYQGYGWAQAVHPDDAKPTIDEWNRAVAERRKFVFEHRVRRHDGIWRTCSICALPMIDHAGEIQEWVGVHTDITDRKAAEASLSESELRYRSLVEQVVDGIFVSDGKGHYLDANKAACEMLGYTLDELRTMNVLDVISPDEHERLPSHLQQLNSGVVVRNEWRFKRKDGSTFIGELVGRSLIDGRLQGIVRDVTEQKQIEMERQEALARLRAFTGCAPVGIAFFDQELRYQMVNESLAEMNGLPIEAHLGRSVEEIVPDLASQARAVHRQIQETGNPTVDHDFSGETQKAPGEVRHWAETWFPVATADGRQLGIGAVVLEVTDRKRTEQARSESELRFRALVETVPAILYSLTPAGKLDFLSPKFTEITGLALPEAQDLAGFPNIHDEDRPKFLDRLTKALTSGQRFECEYRLLGQDGRYRWFLTRAVPVTEETGRVVKWFGAAYDINQQKQNEAALQALNEELNRFAFAASHDLREPLRNIRGFTDLLVEHASSPKPLLDEKQFLKAMSVVASSVEKMDQLLADLLEYSVIGDPSGTAHELESSVALQKAVKHLSDTIAKSGAEIVAGDLPAICARESEIISLFQNLIENAIKYRGPHAPRISISATSRNGEWLFSVEDNGMGIEKQYARHIFGMFKRLAGGEVPGTGIGLAIVEKIVTRYGGTIWVESEVGKGSNFLFTWPVTGRLHSSLPWLEVIGNE